MSNESYENIENCICIPRSFHSHCTQLCCWMRHLRTIPSRLRLDSKNNKAAVHCMLRPRHPTARCRHPPSSRTRRSQYDKAKTLACARRRNDVTRCNGIDMPSYDVLCANMTSSTKSEVHNVSLAPQPQGTVPRPQVTRTKFCEDQEICSWTNIHTRSSQYSTLLLEVE